MDRYDWEESNRNTVLEGTEALLRASESLERSRRIAEESEGIGTCIIADLGTQRESLERVRDSLQNTDHFLTQSHKLLNSMYRRALIGYGFGKFVMLKKNVVVGMSGGVDSAVSALILKSKGFRITGVFMKNWDAIEEEGPCSVEQDAEDAEFACKKLGIPFRAVSFVKDYWNEVFTYMLDSYKKGFTPNPDIMCNRKIKFGRFFDYATTRLGADALATGHYARTTFGSFLENSKESENVSLLKAADKWKDQTFFLSQIPQEPLRKTMFPLGELAKSEVKRIAVENGLERIAKKHESMGICFIGPRNFRQFIMNYVEPEKGKFIDIDTGKVVGTHDGVHLWVVGQKIRIPGQDSPRYVLRKNNGNDVIVGAGLGSHHPALLSYMIITGKPHWISGAPKIDSYAECECNFHHTESSVKCRLIPFESGGLSVILEKPLSRINPGQFAVFYRGDTCLGSAEILRVGPTLFSLDREVPQNFREFHDKIEPFLF